MKQLISIILALALLGTMGIAMAEGQERNSGNGTMRGGNGAVRGGNGGGTDKSGDA